jgi:beta-N-acetylhexosaminidase
MQTLREQIGQMLLFGWNGETEDDRLDAGPHALALIDELAVGGVIIMGRNAQGAAHLTETIAALQERNASAGRAPLFVAVDQEGGRVQRLLPPDFTRVPSAREIAQSGDPAVARASAAAIAQELSSCGINWDFAPVLDVNNNPDNPVIGARSYSDDPAVVAAMGVAAVRGFQEDGNILACGKHFPGHGDTDTDSHHALPRIPHGRERLDRIELVPFRAAISAGIDAIMTAHILFPALNPERPATLSPAILTGLLREELGFDGLVITDDLEMRGVADDWGAAEAAVLAVNAGADVLLCCHTLSTQQAIRDALIAAVESGRIPRTRIEESCERIARVKRDRLANPAG